MTALGTTCSATALFGLAMLKLHLAMGTVGQRTQYFSCKAREMPLPQHKSHNRESRHNL